MRSNSYLPFCAVLSPFKVFRLILVISRFLPFPPAVPHHPSCLIPWHLVPPQILYLDLVSHLVPHSILCSLSCLISPIPSRYLHLSFLPSHIVSFLPSCLAPPILSRSSCLISSPILSRSSHLVTLVSSLISSHPPATFCPPMNTISNEDNPKTKERVDVCKWTHMHSPSYGSETEMGHYTRA